MRGWRKEGGGWETYNVVEFEVAVHDGVFVAGHILADEVDNLVVVLVGSAQFLSGIFILDFGLLCLDAGVGVAVASVEVVLFAVVLEAYGVGIYTVEPR